MPSIGWYLQDWKQHCGTLPGSSQEQGPENDLFSLIHYCADYPLTSVFQLLKLAFSIFYSHSSTCNQSPWAAKGLSEETSVPAT